MIFLIFNCPLLLADNDVFFILLKQVFMSPEKMQYNDQATKFLVCIGEMSKSR